MQRLKHSELRSLSEALLELYAPRAYADFPARLIGLGRRLFSCDIYGYNEFAGHKAIRAVHEPALSGSLEVFNDYVGQDPSAIPLLQGKVRHSVKISDFATLNQWQRSDLYNNFFRLEGINYQLAFLISGPYRVGITLNRSERDFSEAERSALDLLGPHFAQAYQISKLFSLMSDANESAGRGLIDADNAGRILSGDSKAIAWLMEYFGCNRSLPTELRNVTPLNLLPRLDLCLMQKLQQPLTIMLRLLKCRSNEKIHSASPPFYVNFSSLMFPPSIARTRTNLHLGAER